MKEADLQVQKALTKAGYGAWPASSRGELFESLAQIRKLNPFDCEDFVDQLRKILDEAAHQEEVAEFELLRTQSPFIKACPECSHKPDLGQGYTTANGTHLVVCMNHSDGAVTRGGKSLLEAVESWNADDWFTSRPTRALFSI